MLEARAVSALNHPHIVTIYDIGETVIGRFIVMELIKGRTLRALAAKPLTVESLVQCGRQVANALAAAHARGIVHGDIKPANLFVADRRQAKILDFGLAKLVAERGRPYETAANLSHDPVSSPGTALGTVAYMSPEQARGEDTWIQNRLKLSASHIAGLLSHAKSARSATSAIPFNHSFGIVAGFGKVRKISS